MFKMIAPLLASTVLCAAIAPAKAEVKDYNRSKRSWRIPTGTEVPLQVGFDGAAFGKPVNAFGGVDAKAGAYVTSHIAPEAVQNFIREFSEGNKMWIRFGGNEEPWIIDLTGSRGAAEAFTACTVRVPKPTQPYTSQAPTQPFQSPPTVKPAFNGQERGA
jgi:hypothetical protein